MAIQTKGQLFFESDSGEGFSETWWSQPADMATAASDLAALCTKRLGLATNNVKCVYAKVHNIVAPRTVSVVDAVIGDRGAYVPTGPNPVAHDSQEVLVVRMDTTIFKRNTRFLHMLGSWTNQGDTFNPEAAWTTAFNNWAGDITSKYVAAFGFAHGIPGNFQTIDNVLVERVSNHKVGRPFGLPRGSRPIRV